METQMKLTSEQQEILNGIAEQNKEIYEGRMRRKSTRILPFQ